MGNINFRSNKGFYKKIAWIIIFVIFCTLLYMPKNSIKADASVITYDNKIKILEIEPGNQYLLGGTSTDDKPITKNSTDGHSVSITRMPMTKFISMVDEINGQYDVVVIGRVNSGLNSVYKKGIPYRDYTKPTSQTFPSLPLTWWQKSSNPTTATVDGVTMVEYCPENDVTDKRAKEIINMIKSGQLVYADNSIFTTDAAKEISTTKLYRTFKKDIKNYPNGNPTNNAWKDNDNFKPLNQSEINIDSIVRDYVSSNNKRPKVNQIVKPTDDSEVKDTKGQLSNRQMNFNITMGETGTFRAKLYLDINADGLFKGTDKVKELVETDEFTIDPQNLQHILQHDLDKNFIGYLDWKIEITKVASPEIKTNLLGNSKYKPLTSTRNINVLQIKTNTNYPAVFSKNSVGNGDLIDLSTDTNFKKLIEDNSVKNDYTIKVTSMTIKEANSKALGGILVLNGAYDMVILGFEDGFGVYSSNYEDFNGELINLLKEYMKTGQSVMFTHDTMAPALAYHDYGYITGAQALTRTFRDYIGQARYPDPYRSKERVGYDLSGGDKVIGSIDESDLTKDKIVHDIKPNNSAYSIGTTLQGFVNPYNATTQANWPGWGGWTEDVEKVKGINSAQINQYPFTINNTMSVAKTHTQWFQLNLEDEDVVPWFNLYDDVNNTFDSLDSRNNYYTYSKGNITFSGTGHSKETGSEIKFPDDELKLFVNTIIKAERGANHAPTINCSIPLENTDKNPQVNQVPAGRDYYFSVDAEDYEKEDITMHVTINGKKIDSSNIVSKVDFSELDNQQLFKIETSNSKRTSIKFKIPANQLPDVGNAIKVDVEAKDSQGAKSLKNYVLKPLKSTCSIDADFESAKPSPAYLNSTIDVKYKVTPNDYYYSNSLNSQGPIDEAVVLVDISQTMTSNQRFFEVRDGLVNQVIKDKNLPNIKFGIVGYNDSVYIGNRSNYNDPKTCIMQKTDENLSNINKDSFLPLYRMNDANENDGYRQFYQCQSLNKEDGKYLYDRISNNDQRQFGTALKVADEVLTKYGAINAKKAIVIISSGNLTYTDDEIENIRSKGYKIITMDLSNSNSTNIKDTHINLGGNVSESEGDYYKGTVDNGPNYNPVDNDMVNVAKSLEKGIQKTSIISSAKLNFDLGTNFQMVGNTCIEGESITSITGNKYSIDLLNKINYVATTIKDSEGRTKYNANPFEITFQVKPLVKSYGNFGFSGLTFDDQNFENNKLATLGTDSGPNNNFVYNDVFGLKTKNIFTPVVKIIQNAAIKHGLYQGMDSISDSPIIDEGEKTFPKGQQVQFGAYIDGAINNMPIQINFDKNLTTNNIDLSKIKVYKIDGGNRNELNNNGSFINGIYTYTPSGLSDSSGKILIVYTEVLPEAPGTYTNVLKVYGMPDKDVRIKVLSDQELPDLF